MAANHEVRRFTPSTRWQDMQPTTVLESRLTCPHCGFTSTETMPTDACVYFHRCTGCQALLRPKAGDCCVFCSYGSIPCPPVQEARGCCGNLDAPRCA
jgi:hypothetical protein